jgi:ribosomal protein S18 acetylase RimI-like enzyme
MLYRLYRSQDFSQLYAIEQTCFQPPFRFPRRYMRQLVDSPDSATWIAVEDRQMAGFAIVDWTRELPREPGQTIAYIQTVEVTPPHRNRGIANELLRRIETSAGAAGATALWLHVAEQNAAAIRLYQAHGYLLKGREENYYAAGIPALIFAKTLESAPAA